MCWHTELLPVTLVSLWLLFNEVTPLRHLSWKPMPQISGKVSILGFFCFCFWKLEPPLFLTFFYLCKIEWVMAFVLLCTNFAPPKCLTILCSDGAHTMLGTFIWQFIISSVHTWAHHSSAFVATCAAHTLLGIVTQSFISASVHFSEPDSLYSVHVSALYNPTSCFEWGLWGNHLDKNHEAHTLLGTAGNGCQPSQCQTKKLLGADASSQPEQTNKHSLDVNNSSTAVFGFQQMCNTLALAKESWIKHTCKFIVAKGWPEYLYGQRLAPVTDIIRLTKFLVSISLTTALLFLFSVHTAQVQQLYHLQLVHPLEKQHCAWISSTPLPDLHCFVQTWGAHTMLWSFIWIFHPLH